MTDYHKLERNGKTYRLVYDETHETRGSFGYDTEDETKASEDNEFEKLESGKWIVLGCIVTAPCQSTKHCDCCSGIETLDSLWGIVIENNTKTAEAFVLDNMIQ